MLFHIITYILSKHYDFLSIVDHYFLSSFRFPLIFVITKKDKHSLVLIFTGRRRIRTFEAIATDLQSAPFGRSGIHPYAVKKRTLKVL